MTPVAHTRNDGGRQYKAIWRTRDRKTSKDLVHTNVWKTDVSKGIVGSRRGIFPPLCPSRPIGWPAGCPPPILPSPASRRGVDQSQPLRWTLGCARCRSVVCPVY
eukprot:2554005-Pyramimonas_sp.AAC.1